MIAIRRHGACCGQVFRLPGPGHPRRILPTLFELLRGGVQLTRQLREVHVEDLLGRDPVVMELDRVGAFLEDKIVLVTGAGGSHRLGALPADRAGSRPKLLVLLDHAENNLFRCDRELLDEGIHRGVKAVLADVHRKPLGCGSSMQRFKPARRLPRRRPQARAADGGQPAARR